MELSTAQRQYLRGLAHPLNPVVRVGLGGLSNEVVAKTSAELESHELIKVKFQDGFTDPLKEAVESLAGQTGAAVVQVIGRVGVLYRRRKKDATIVLPKVKVKRDEG